MAAEAQNLSREMAHSYLTGTGPPNKRPIQPSFPKNYDLGYAKQTQFFQHSNERSSC